MSSEQLDRIIAMLEAGKPVIMGGWTLSYLDGSHYWVVDGVAIKPGRKLISCNWGWNGASNGWFSIDCIKSNQKVTKVSADTNNGWNHLIVYTYDMAKMTPNKEIHKLYDNRKTYK